jgi:hypothetical protein
VTSHRAKTRILKHQGDLFMAKPDDPGSQGRSQAPGQGGGAPGKSGLHGHSPEAKAERAARRARGEDVPEPPEDEGGTQPSGPTTAPGGDTPQINPLNKP